MPRAKTPTVRVVGIGPAGPEYITAQVRDAIDRSEHRYLRTTRHPSSSAVVDAQSFDHIYEQADTFETVYRTITDQLVASAQEHGEVLYAVPGSPFVLERTVRHLLDDNRVKVEPLAGLSFLDLAYQQLRIDPIEAAVRLIDGHTFLTSAAGQTGALLVAHCHNQRVLSDIKLAVETPPDGPVVVLQRLGLPDEHVVEIGWADLDRSVEADHLTSLYIPSLGVPVASELIAFYEIVRRLRAECPWDRHQTHASLARYAIEETYELVEAIGALGHDGAGDDALEGELGDVLLQVVLHAAIAEQDGRFNLADVAATISEKMVRRHPHVFGDVSVSGADAVVTNWEAIKAAERAERGEVARTTTFDGIDKSLPALSYANELTKAVMKQGFAWGDREGAAAKVREELAEVLAATTAADVAEELGDLLHASVVLARMSGVDPEVALRQSAAKFRRRFDELEQVVTDRNERLDNLAEHELVARWNEAKARVR
jgi:tetrapyrrole methylase family protein / MazG family protein